MPNLSGVQSTKNYNDFGFVHNNRNINNRHVNNLVRSMSEHPDLFASRPILVNETMQIIDGQHRFEAAKQLGMPIYYVIAEGLTGSHAMLLNLNQVNWTPLDFAKHYASGSNGLDSYKEYLTMRESYPTFTHNVVVKLLSGVAGKTSESTKAFKRGEFTINRDVATAYKQADMLIDIRSVMPTPTFSGAICSALLHIFANEQYNHKQMVSKIVNYGDIYLTKSRGKAADYIRDFEDTYNYKQTSENRVRF